VKLEKTRLEIDSLESETGDGTGRRDCVSHAIGESAG